MSGAANNERTWETTDMSTAAYVALFGKPHEVVLLKTERGGGGGGDRYTFVFSDPKGHGPLLQVQFSNSDFRKYDDQIRSLKKLCYDGKSRSRRPARRTG